MNWLLQDTNIVFGRFQQKDKATLFSIDFDFQSQNGAIHILIFSFLGEKRLRTHANDTARVTTIISRVESSTHHSHSFWRIFQNIRRDAERERERRVRKEKTLIAIWLYSDIYVHYRYMIEFFVLFYFCFSRGLSLTLSSSTSEGRKGRKSTFI